ncbi:MAG: tRNA dihydrouridine(20/20a) synthase DusA [Gammaproteobacteria bacterium]|nr:tRNA dihydrouridine(20/20a) synthase DusA [Gammaproteobacteria bacterium]
MHAANSPIFSVAPMMDWTDRHCRYFMRLLSPSALLYTEMITAAAIRHGDAGKLLRYDSAERPIAVQLGGSDPGMMAEAARRAANAGYDEININVGCPSDRVQSGRFGACLMMQPRTVADCFRAMQADVDVPVTVKTRIGIDDLDNDAFLFGFVDELAGAGCRKFVVHARIAILDGLSPKDNRTVPPLNYGRVIRLKEVHPELEIVLNGGVTDINQVDEFLTQVDSVMIGRQAYHHPYFLAELERHFHPESVLPQRRDVIEMMIPYIENELRQGERLGRITRHMIGLFAGMPGARAWRRHISENAYRDGAGIEVILEALDAMPVAA